MKRSFSTIVVVFFLKTAFAQLYFGYYGGYVSHHQLAKEVALYNSLNASNLSRQMQAPHLMNGAVFGYKSKGEHFLELSFILRYGKIASRFDSSGVTMARELKYSSNTLQFGYGMKHSSWIFAISLDAGGYKGSGRRGVASNLRGWDLLWGFGNIIQRIQPGSSIYFGREFGFLTIRLYGQLQFRKMKYNALEDWFFGSSPNNNLSKGDRFNNFGIQLLLRFGSNS